MKINRGGDNNRERRGGHKRVIKHPNRGRNQDHVTEMLKLCLQKICELQAEMQDESEIQHDPEAAGYAACVVETLRFLSTQGLPSDHPIVKALTEKLSGNGD
ncbi:uncharacterized protein LOC132699759 [Cylas formicarius]|uniref:uncharacterized protein LOC132699759 n=1 Tax=Cylas formicarius TaxID=197179 RepID=UPI0029585F7B|nr:uncharacterized protein LOC132699759 [Cylas formicarius]